MKIGILTFHLAHNYGAVLQAYALQEVLKKEGHEVEIINYRPSCIEDVYRLFSLRIYKNDRLAGKIRRFAGRMVTFWARCKRYRKFEQFIKLHLSLSKECSRDKSGIPKGYDVYVFGSDQIWNPRLSHGLDEVYLGRFQCENGARKVAYAASMGTEYMLGDPERNLLAESLKFFYAVGVREESLRGLLSDLRIDSTVVLDPTLIVERGIFDCLAVKPVCPFRYVLLYRLEKDAHAFDFARQIALQLGAEVVEITPYKIWLRDKGRRIVSAISPEEFCGWFKYAACVISISFHGTAFSVIFRKDFYCLKSPLQDRSRNLLESLGLGGRLIASDSPVVFKQVDYSEAEKKMEKLKEISKDFLLNAINGKTS